MCHCGNTGVEQTQNTSQHTKLTVEKKILPLFELEFELGTFRSQVQWSYQQAILANGYVLLIYSIVIMPRGELEDYKEKSILLDQL